MKTYIVTGASSGIGQALSLELAKRGHRVILVGRRLARLQITAAHYPDNMIVCQANVTTQSGRRAIIEAAAAYPHIDGLIHNAGLIKPLALIPDIDAREWRCLMRTNVEAPLFISQALLPQLRGGRILHLSTLFAHVPAKGCTAYCMSKAALHMLYQCQNLEFKEYDISTASASPGVTDTAMLGLLCDAKDIPGTEFFREVQQQQRVVPTAMVAKFLAWLLLDVDEARFAEKPWDIYEEHHHSEWLGAAVLPTLP